MNLYKKVNFEYFKLVIFLSISIASMYVNGFRVYILMLFFPPLKSS